MPFTHVSGFHAHVHVCLPHFGMLLHVYQCFIMPLQMISPAPNMHTPHTTYHHFITTKMPSADGKISEAHGRARHALVSKHLIKAMDHKNMGIMRLSALML